MSRQGGTLQMKRLNAPKVQKIQRKEATWIVKQRGAHPKQQSIAIAVVLRDYLGIVDNMREAKFVLNNGEILVNGKVVKDHKRAVGLFDIVEIPKLKKKYAVLLDHKGRLELKEIDYKEGNKRILRIEIKKAVKGNKIQLTTSSGETFLLDKTKLKPFDSIVVENNKIVKELPLTKGATIYVVAGARVSNVGEVLEIQEGSTRREKSIKVKANNNQEFETVARNVVVVGEKGKIELKYLEKAIKQK
ncbi:MAG: 30S ribosomal protein S4e [Candidatus Diapherotrites archaeon]|nr:30S ribosomal protein S4e [Candidatus Diapherotrites archaeon]